MGTSASNGGPKGSPPLLPDWYNPSPPDGDDQEAPQDGNNDSDGENDATNNNDPENTDSPEQNNSDAPNQTNQSTDWAKSKGALTRIAKSTSGSSIQKAGRKYVSGLGGRRGATRAAAQGRITGGKYASFLGAIASGGINNALQNLGLHNLLGRSSEEICLAIADAIAPIGSTNDEAIARDALISTLDSLYNKLQENGNDFTNVDSLSLDQIKETLIDYVSNYVFNKWMYELGNAIEKGSVTESDAINLEIEVRDLIYAETFEYYRDIPVETFNISDSSNNAMIEEIFQTAYSTLET
ncbi:Qat anti-phage system associated protein QatB [Chryseobacterium aquaticum]|uniref:Uncharacterized protein n=1 Tax=Chryseobacterium aquaticum subsp. greenlandense TaxID=345663 RepID=A0A124F2Q9_9FLAO|nr:Qat anti-phage system associated protein QatB [Chryseobacterium aquaticum]KUJ55634.1 hypothetical protein AR686_12555 [Chryseobacterium aquaticum subsp. greenlandense]